MSHHMTFMVSKAAIISVVRSITGCEKTSRYTLEISINITKMTRQDMRIEYIQCFLIIMRKRVPSFSSFSRSFVSHAMSNDLNIQVMIRLKLMNIGKGVMCYDFEYMSFWRFAKKCILKSLSYF